MARYNEILVGRYARGLQKLFGVKGEVPIGSLAGELVAVHTVFNGVENRYLEGWEIFGSPQNAIATVGQSGGAQLRNPSGGNALVVVEKLTVVASAATSVSLTAGSGADLTTVGTGQSRGDARTRPVSTVVPSLSVASPANLGNALGLWLLIANQPYDIIQTDEQEIVITPGTSLRVVAATVNVQLVATFFWRERFQEESERT